MSQLRIHNVTKIEVKKVNKGKSYICRDLVIHHIALDRKTGEEVSLKTSIDLFLEDASASKLVYSKEMY
tara:strand:+ start:3982 stop:4188 length:207 start_codon:yes stop_codon:yes gene_type:complete